jgi:hypothetical protein
MRRPLGTPRAAVVLWIVFAIVVWNVVFDRILVVAGRQYVHAATLAARKSDTYLRIDDAMRPARARALRAATVAALVVLAAGVMGTVVARRRGPHF